MHDTGNVTSPDQSEGSVSKSIQGAGGIVSGVIRAGMIELTGLSSPFWACKACLFLSPENNVLSGASWTLELSSNFVEVLVRVGGNMCVILPLGRVDSQLC